MYNGAIQNTIDAFAQLPGIGPKGAQRIAFYLLTAPENQVKNLVNAISVLKEKVRFCSICGNVTETDPCVICNDPRRDRSIICVVEDPKDVMSIERTGQYRGLYHVLGGAINPMADIGPSDLRIKELLERLQIQDPQTPSLISNDDANVNSTHIDRDEVKEVILALNPNIEGEATATYLINLLTPISIKVTRLASGLPVGSDLEYADEITLGRALIGRR